MIAVKALYEELDIHALKVYVDASANAGDRRGTLGIPTTLLIDPNGQEIGRVVGPAPWDSAESVRHLKEQINRLLGTRLRILVAIALALGKPVSVST